MSELDRSARQGVPDQGDSAEPRRYLFYSHDGVGLGHTARNLAIARALTEEDPTATILLATGTDDALQLGVPERVEILKLPSLRKLSNDQDGARRLLVSGHQIHALRSALLTGTVESFRPHVMLVDKHPLGAGGELTMGLAALKQQGGAAVLGLRDILDEPAVVMAEWDRHSLAELIDEAYDQILIYGDALIFDPIREYHLPASLAQKACYCGYVTRDRSRRHPLLAESLIRPRPGLPCVMATVGGGEDGNQPEYVCA
jgi:predicted glycosyltransferase